jgi:hypothetical protein
MVQVSSEYISVGCNRTAHAACWGNSGLVAFGADTLIALYSPLVIENTYIVVKKKKSTYSFFYRVVIAKVFKRHFQDIMVVSFV